MDFNFFLRDQKHILAFKKIKFRVENNRILVQNRVWSSGLDFGDIVIVGCPLIFFIIVECKSKHTQPKQVSDQPPNK